MIVNVNVLHTFRQSAHPSISGYLPYRRTESMKRRFTEVWRTAD